MILERRFSSEFPEERATQSPTSERQPDALPRPHSEDTTNYALRHAYDVVALLRDYRESYGMGILMPSVFQSAAIAAFTFLEDLRPREPHEQRRSPARKPRSDSHAAEISDSSVGFEECFRVLLAGGMQMMLPRAITRAVLSAAKDMNVKLPDAVYGMLKLMTSAAWQPSDVRRLSSFYPNWAVKGKDRKAALLQELLEGIEGEGESSGDGGGGGGGGDGDEHEAEIPVRS